MSTAESPKASDFEELAGEVELNAPEDFAKALVAYAVEVKANDIFISDDQAATSIRLRQMGRVREIRKLTRDYGKRLQNHYRTLSAIEAIDVHRPSEGRTQFELDDDSIVDVRVSSIPSLFGSDVAIRLARQDSSIASISELGMLPDEEHQIHRLLDAPSGLVLVAGPTGSGKTHSLYSFIDYLNNGQRKIHTIEDPIERILPGIVQSQVSHRAGLEFQNLLLAVLRHSPDVIMIGEIRDERTAAIGVKAAASGQLVLSTIHSQTAASAIDTMLAYGIDRNLLSSTLIGAVSQRLVRRLCPNCRQTIHLPNKTQVLSDSRKLLGISEPILASPQGCSQCRDLGFDRLVCVPEILIGTAEIRSAIASGCTTSEIEQTAIRDGMRTLREAARLRIASGEATAEDLYQILPPKLD